MENLCADLRPREEWTPPATREEADEAILRLSNDIGLILAQLAEDQGAWCDRTGRSAADYAAWRRRALFAKVHKESQLRECKRLRVQLIAGSSDSEASRFDSALSELMACSRDVVERWVDAGGDAGSVSLNGALRVLATRLDQMGRPEREVNLMATRADRPIVVSASGN